MHITDTTKELAPRWREIANQFIFPFVVTSGGPRPPWMHFLPVCGFLLVLCPSWVMDYLSAISQSNHIQRCSSSCDVMPLFISSLLRLCYYYMALVFPPLTFNCSPFGFLPHTLRLLCVFVTRNLHLKGSWNNLVWEKVCFLHNFGLFAWMKYTARVQNKMRRLRWRMRSSVTQRLLLMSFFSSL